ncbi:formin-binding protein 1-like isoform X2 [Gigantopelta aegis]|uniref:formin-binding protein 1-like isoform X2 n=1 Tax=Gigantopelta aegis TaxID=1735272 RepID=UPI001B8875E3|nr:formin-binding protein 1-like isoform X2 [Gigantopelta aegis]
MSWGLELWDQYDNVGQHTEKGIYFCEKFTHFLKERCTIEQEYARSLKRLVKNFQPKKKEENEYQFSWAKAFVDMIKELHDLAGQHEVIAENLQGTVSKELHVLISELKQERRKHLAEGSKLQEQLQRSTNLLERSKRQYERAFKESEKALDNYRKADADINLSRAEVEKDLCMLKQKAEKYRVIMNSKATQCEECKNDYASQLQNTNLFQREYYTSLMPKVFQDLQDIDEKRINKIQEFIGQCANTEHNVIPIINTCIEGMNKAANSINAKEDSKLVIARYKSGYSIPEDIPFEDLSVAQTNENNHTAPKQKTPADKNTIKSATLSGRQKTRKGIFGIFSGSKTDNQNEDFSDLPPNQRRRKLQSKIDNIKRDMAKEQAEREGMLKMRDVYASNTALGDPSSLDKKIEENAQKIDTLRHELQKFESFLVECDGKHRRHSASDDSLSQSVSEGSVHQQDPEQKPPINTSNMYQAVEGDFTDGDEFDNYSVIGTCRALYPFDGSSEGSILMNENEEMYVLEQDQGDGWTRVRRDDGSEGFVPTSYVSVHLYESDQV